MLVANTKIEVCVSNGNGFEVCHHFPIEGHFWKWQCNPPRLLIGKGSSLVYTGIAAFPMDRVIYVKDVP